MDKKLEFILKEKFNNFLESLPESPKEPGDDEKITIDMAAGGVYFIYEKIRNAVDYRELNLLRKNAIERFLKRKAFLSDPKKKYGEKLVSELIKTRYVQNGTLPRSVVEQCNETILKFSSLYSECVRGPITSSTKNIYNEMIGFMACEIDQIIHPRATDNLYLDFVFNDIKDNSDLHQTKGDAGDDLSVTLYSAIHRTLMKSDSMTILYYLFLETYPQWKNMKSEEVAGMARDYLAFRSIVTPDIKGATTIRTQKIVQRIMPPYIVLRDIVNLHSPRLKELFGSSATLSETISTEHRKSYTKARANLLNSIIRSIIFLFLTKSVVALLVEVPFNRLVMHSEKYLPIIANLILPPLYLFLIGILIKIPGESNERKMINRIFRIVYETDNPLKYKFTYRRNLSRATTSVFNLVYFAISVFLFLAITMVLYRIGFNYLDIFIFFIFLSTVSFFGIRITNSARSLNIEREKRGIIVSLFEFLITPFMELGQWISDTYSKVNVFTFVLDFLIEAPLKSILGIFEQWSSFVREKREDLL